MPQPVGSDRRQEVVERSSRGRNPSVIDRPYRAGVALPPETSRHPGVGGLGAEILRWPEDGERRRELQLQGHPRLLLLAPDAQPPPPEAGEDWAWSPIDERDLATRLRRLARPGDPSDGLTLHVDVDGVLRTSGRILPLPPVEAALLRCLAERPGRARSRAELHGAAWGGAPRATRSLDSRILSTRRRIRPLRLGIVAVRGQGFVLVRTKEGEQP